jgi:hypothetical protein
VRLCFLFRWGAGHVPSCIPNTSLCLTNRSSKEVRNCGAWLRRIWCGALQVLCLCERLVFCEQSPVA